MSEQIQNALVFAARPVIEKLLARHFYSATPRDVANWARKAADKYPQISRCPIWWLGSAAADPECLDAMKDMLVNGQPK